MKPRAHRTKHWMSDLEIYCAMTAVDIGSSEKCFEWIGRIEETGRMPLMQCLGRDGIRV